MLHHILNRVWARYLILFGVYALTMSVAPHPVPLFGMVMWVATAITAWYKPIHRATIIQRGLQVILGFSGLLLFVVLFRAYGKLTDLVEWLGTSPVDAQQVELGLRIGLSNLALSFTLFMPVIYLIYCGKLMFWDYLSNFFAPTARIEDVQTSIKRGGPRQ
ncbi:MAG: hypothetical protein KJ734_03225 [Chloroflexi bacterium]|nr:hypothetical protein [Chloroflexota bacterium]